MDLFKLVDLDVKSYNHGGGWVEYKGQSTIEPGAFKYKSPCPPNVNTNTNGQRPQNLKIGIW